MIPPKQSNKNRKAAYHLRACNSRENGLVLLVYSYPLTHKLCKRRRSTMKNGNEFGGAKLAWDMFEKTGSIAYYMLFLELNGGRHHS